MKNATISKMYYHILESMSDSDIKNAYFGGCNLTANYLNDYSSDAVSSFIGDFLESYGEQFKVDNSFSDVIENPNYLLQMAACEFHSALEYIAPGNGERILKNADCYFESWGNFYIFAEQWSNACCRYWIVRAENESEAYSILVSEFEDYFTIDEDDIIEDQEYNDNGNPVSTDNLMLFGCIKGQ